MPRFGGLSRGVSHDIPCDVVRDIPGNGDNGTETLMTYEDSTVMLYQDGTPMTYE